MKYCRSCGRITPEAPCARCTRRLLERAAYVPLRVREPQAWPRCHTCWNLSPVCRCDGWLRGLNPDPDLDALLDLTR